MGAPRSDAETPAGGRDPASGDGPALGAQLLAVEVDLLYRRNLISGAAGLPLAVAVYIALWSELDRGDASAWLAIKCATCLGRTALGLAYRWRAAARPPATWQRWYIATLAVDGLTWALLYTWFASNASAHDTVRTAAILATLLGIASVAGVVLSMHLPGNAAFTASTLGPVAMHSLWLGTDSLRVLAAGGTLGLLAMNLLNGWHASRANRELLRLRFELDGALALANRRSAVKSQFLATMSHELRTPLHGLLGTIRLMRGSASGGEQLERLAILEQSGDQLLGLIDDVLEASRIEAGRLPLREAPFDLAGVALDVAALFSAAAHSGAVRLELALELPGAGWTLGDSARVRQILLNLVGNAVKFTEHGVVRIGTAVEGDRVRVEVADTGPGIAAAELDRIFEPFHQADGSFTRRHGGAGLGLYISRELARTMSGALRCASEPGAGATFTLELPWRPVPVPVPVRPPGPRAPAPRLAGRVLLAEDNALNVSVARAALEELGLAVTVAADGEAAVAAFCAEAPDAVLMDCHMPGVSGFEATRRIRAEEAARGARRTPIVAVTASALPEDRRRSLDAGMDELVAKPFSAEALGAILGRYLAPAPAPAAPDATPAAAPAAPDAAPAAPDAAPAAPRADADADADADALADAEEAIARLAGDRALYGKLLEGFAADHASGVQAIEDALARGDSEDAARRAHTLKGLAATLGARRLAVAARALEAALRDGAPPPRVDACLAEAAAALRGAVEACGRRLTPGSPPGAGS